MTERIESGADGPAATPTGGPSDTRARRRFGAGSAISVAVTLALIVALAAMDRVGGSARAVPAVTPPVVVVDDSRALLAAWEDAGIHGAVLVDATADLGYTPVARSALPSAAAWPVPLVDPETVFRSRVDRRNLIWVAAKTGIARSVTYVLPSADLAEKVRVGRAAGFPGISRDGRSIRANDDGYLRWIGEVFPQGPPDAAVLNIDASYFVNGTPEQLAERLGGSLGAYRLVTLDRALDATSVPDSARAGIDRTVGILRGQGLR